MAMVKCTGTEKNVLECPFGESSDAQAWRDYDIKDGCDSARGVGLCCDVSVCVCMCVCVRICISICIICIYFLCIYTLTHTYIHIYVFTYIRIYIYTYIHIYIHTYIRIFKHTYMHTNTHRTFARRAPTGVQIPCKMSMRDKCTAVTCTRSRRSRKSLPTANATLVSTYVSLASLSYARIVYV
jgi:hypothetical protein